MMPLTSPIRALLVAAVLFGQAAIGAGAGWGLSAARQGGDLASAVGWCGGCGDAESTGWEEACCAAVALCDTERKHPVRASRITKHHELVSLRRVRQQAPVPLTCPPVGDAFRLDVPVSDLSASETLASGSPSLVALQVRLDC